MQRHRRGALRVRDRRVPHGARNRRVSEHGLHLGCGMAWRKNGLILDGRFSMHPATSADMLREANLSTWDVNAKAGFEF
jgi:hypothetical protein